MATPTETTTPGAMTEQLCDGRRGHCLWCGKMLPTRRRRGSEQKFCTAGHRGAYARAARRWAVKALETGLVTLEEIKQHA